MAREISVLITSGSSEGSGEPAQSLLSLHCPRTQSMDVEKWFDKILDK